MEFGRTPIVTQPTGGASVNAAKGASTDQMGKTAQLLLAQYAPTTGAREMPTSSASALRRHESVVAVLIDLIVNGANAAEGSTWRNTCEWLLACKVGLHVLSLRHDSADQVAKAEKTEKKGYDPALDGAYFGIDHAVPLGSAPTTRASYGKITIVPFAERRFTQAGKIVLLNPSEDRDELKRLISYEVQLAVSHEHPSTDVDRYRSEFNARWVAGYHADKSDRAGSAAPIGVNNRKVAMHNARQAAVFADIYNTSEGVAPAWNDWWSGRSFQKAVYNLKAPQGKNLANSLRIDNLYLALTADPINMGDVNASLAGLSSHDREAILNPVGGMVNVWHDILRDAALAPEDRTSIARDLGIYGFSP